MATELSLFESPHGDSPSLSADLRAWFQHEYDDWDAQVARSSDTMASGAGTLWNCMPIIDSKAVARTSPIFKQHLGIPLDVRMIRAGGYPSPEAVISDLVPRMERLAKEKKQ